jgi:Ni/Co efflux regulator RcnB
MAKNNGYSAVKSRFVMHKMAAGITNEQARKEWKKSAERKDVEDRQWDAMAKNTSYGREWQRSNLDGTFAYNGVTEDF